MDNYRGYLVLHSGETHRQRNETRMEDLTMVVKSIPVNLNSPVLLPWCILFLCSSSSSGLDEVLGIHDCMAYLSISKVDRSLRYVVN